MPFYKYIIQTRKTEFGRDETQNEFNTSAVANQRAVNAMRNLSQLIQIADDIFGAIEIECRSVHQRTTKLNIKIQHFQGIVNNLNAKAVKVPRGSLSESPNFEPPFKSCGNEVSIFSNFPRPPAVDKLRDSADGPFSPVLIPSGMVASQVEGTSNTSTHIYCKPLKIKDGSKSRSNVVSGDSNGEKKMIPSNAKVPSSVVAIDVSGQPFSRMASFRRSLIHVDFLIRRKRKKDKRRNTVAEGDVKDFRDALQKIVDEDCQFTLTNSICSYQEILAESGKQIISAERNNNAANVKSMKKHSCINESIPYEHASGKRKPKSHIPISTVSAAMNVAVEMRHCNGIRRDDNSDEIRLNDQRNSNNNDASPHESWTTYSKRLQEKCRNLTNNSKSLKEVEVSSTASSENNTTLATSTESDTFFISSDESDEDSSDVAYFQENYGSSTSLGTASDGSLNSLLSETGTEMTSSTGTLTSVGHEHLLTPPPPPPMILSATLIDKDIIAKVSDSECLGIDTMIVKGKNNITTENGLQKQVKETKSFKSSKPFKSDFLDLHRNLTENSRNIFTSLVSLKTHTKDKNKSKYKEKLSKSSHQPAFDMYGNNSPTNEKQIPTFIKENTTPVIHNEGKSDMRSFFVNDRPFLLETEMVNKFKSDFTPNKNIPCCNNSNFSDVTKGIQTASSIPPKYEHQVKVKPVQRCKAAENKIMHPRTLTERENLQNLVSRQRSGNAEIRPSVLQPNPPVTLQQERSKAARVVLDFNGRVIYSTNSLDRKHYNTGHNVNMQSTVQNVPYDTLFKDVKLNNSYFHSQQISPLTSYSSKVCYPRGKAPLPAQINYSIKQNGSENEPHKGNEFSLLDQAYDHQFSASNWQKSESMETFLSRPYSYVGHFPEAYLNNPLNNVTPDPNISGLPVHQETKLTRHNVDLHSKQMEKMSMNASENSYNAFCLSSSQKNSGNILNKSPQGTMSTEDLFAVIHNCKKRMNIKTDSDISLASSSRSNSPSYLRPSSSKSTLAETGFLSPRSQVHFETSGDRRSWADFRPVDSICNERKSLASDRLGPTKPTSMHDFKMLLLQARTNSQISGPRKSAVEMLKVPLNQNNRKTLSSLPFNSASVSVENSATTELSFHNGHSTVPFKRGNRVRASLQPRYIMYPPIFEDCSEDSENCSDLISNKFAATAPSIENHNHVLSDQPD